MTLSLCRLVLVGTQFPGNVGATARAMRNFGLEDLVLVRPECDHLDRNARQLSTQGEGILHRARVVATLPEAIDDCVLVTGTSARVGGLFRKQSVGNPNALLPATAATLRGGHKAALVFGPERNGLTNDETTLCNYLVQIPTADDYPALNLAQSVVICLYELHQAWLDQRDAGLPVVKQVSSENEESATWAEQDQMFAHLQSALERIHFLHGDKAGALMHAVRHLLGRAELSRMEVRLLRGLARQIEWVADRL